MSEAITLSILQGIGLRDDLQGATLEQLKQLEDAIHAERQRQMIELLKKGIKR